MRIGIIDYKIGNLGSVYSALEFYKYNIRIVDRPEGLKDTDIIILTGVGSFNTAVSRLKEKGFWEVIDEEVKKNSKPILGICLGMQLFGESSYEGGGSRGFGWIKGKVIKIDDPTVRVPHIGWNIVTPHNDLLFRNMASNYFYFMHSYHLIPEEKGVIAATAKYGNTEVVSAVKKNNIFGVQFHPEKSQGDGLRFFKNFMESLL